MEIIECYDQCNCHMTHLYSFQGTVDACENSPCEKGDCTVIESGGYKCLCDPGFTGLNCDTNTGKLIPDTPELGEGWGGGL